MKISSSAVAAQTQQSRERLSDQITNRQFTIRTSNGEANDSASEATRLAINRSDLISLNTSSKVVSVNQEAQQFNSSVLVSAISESLISNGQLVVGQRMATEEFEQSTVISMTVETIRQIQEQESVDYLAEGMVTLEDGREIQFAMDFSFNRYTQAEQLAQFASDVLTDPLMININGGVVELRDEIFEFDLTMDGDKEQIAKTATGTGYLVFDKNQNGEIDDGSEMFGPQSGSGWSELAQYDDDNNGWIDENDAVYEKLGYLGFDAEGAQQYQLLSDVGIGAIYLGSEQTEYQMFDSNGNLQAEVKRTGFALHESGEMAHMQELDMRDYRVSEEPEFFIPSEITMTFGTQSTAEIQVVSAQQQVADFAQSVVSNTTFSLSDLRDRALQNMNLNISEYRGSRSQTSQHVSIVDAAEFRYLENLPGRIMIDTDSLDSKTAELHMLIESLKEIREQQREGLKKLSLYQVVQS